MKKETFYYTAHDSLQIPVRGYIIGHLGVDRQSRFSPEREAKHYRVTHLPSGLSFASVSFLLRRDALAFCKAAQETWDISGESAEKIKDRKTGAFVINTVNPDSGLNLRNQIRTLARQHNGDY